MVSSSVDFTIVTPSLNMLPYLKRCCASVGDQEGVSLEHFVQDACSTDGTTEWLQTKDGVVSTIEKDNGMYDAVNKGFRRASGDILAYLNCDEQYLPGTLEYVKNYFDSHPNIDILFGGALLVRPDGSLIAYRKAYQPRWPYIWVSHLYLHSCSMFVRRRVIERGFLFDDNLTAIADSNFIIHCLRNGCRVVCEKRYFSAFTMTGNNLSTSDNASVERCEFLKQTPQWISLLWYPLNTLRLIEKLLSGAYWERFPLTYALFLPENEETRKKLVAERGSFRWRES
ncbi:MAG: glycosyltransferase [Spirochaetes bacterium]|nr:glycosyltransferase [Spirochaetota bacterium]